jgi:hypothetical protein
MKLGNLSSYAEAECPKALNKASEDGWEVVTAVVLPQFDPNNGAIQSFKIMYTLKRPK